MTQIIFPYNAPMGFNPTAPTFPRYPNVSGGPSMEFPINAGQPTPEAWQQMMDELGGMGGRGGGGPLTAADIAGLRGGEAGGGGMWNDITALRGGAGGAGGAGAGGLGLEGDIAALRGGAGGGGALEQLGGAGGLGGRLGGLFGEGGTFGGGAIGGALGAEGLGGRIGGALAGARANLPGALAFTAAGIAGKPIVGGAANLVAPGTGGAAGSAFGSMMNDAALGTALAGPAGGIVGEAVGGLGAIKNGVAELGDANDYQKTAGAFHKAINSDALKGTQAGDQYVALAQAIHNGQPIPVPDGKGGTTQKVFASIADKNAALQSVVSDMQNYAKNADNPRANPPSTDQLLQVQMGQAAANAGASFANSGNAMAASLRAMEDSAPANLKPLLEAEATQREGYGNQMQQAMVMSTMTKPMIDQMNQQLAYQQQILNSMRQQGSAGSNGSLSQIVNASTSGNPIGDALGLAQDQAGQSQQQQYMAGLLNPQTPLG